MPAFRAEDLGSSPFSPAETTSIRRAGEQDIAAERRIRELPHPAQAAFESENIGVATLMRLQQRSEEQATPILKDYNPFKDPQVENDPRMLGIEHAFSESRSPEQTALIKRRVIRGMDNHESLANAGPAGMAWVLTASLVDPINFVPGIGEAIKAESVGGAFVRGAASAFVSGLSEEMILQQLQDERPDLDETQLKNMVAMSTMFGALGAFAKGIDNSTTELLLKERVAEMDDIRNVAEKVTDEGWRIDPALSAEDNFSAWTKVAQKVAPEMSELAAKGSWRGKALKALFEFGPGRTASSPFDGVRKTLKILSDTSGFLTKFEEGGGTFGPAVETRAHAWRVFHLTAGVADMNDAFDAYRKAGGQEIAKARDFYSAVGRAMRRGDQAAEDILDPALREAVSSAAKSLRNQTIDPLWKSAVDVGLYHTVDADLKGTAPSYFMRVYDRERIKGLEVDGLTFRDTLAEWLRRNPDKLKKGETPESLAAKFEHSILKTDKGTVHMGMVREAGPLKDRVLLIPDRLIEPWLVDDAAQVAGRYVNTIAGEVELARAFREAFPDEIKAIQGRLDQYRADLEDLERAGKTAKEIGESIQNERAVAAFQSSEMKKVVRDAIDREKQTLSEVRGYEAQIKAERAKGRMSRRAMADELTRLKDERVRLRESIREWKKSFALFDEDPDLSREARRLAVEEDLRLKRNKIDSERLEKLRNTARPSDLDRLDKLETQQLEAMYRLDDVRNELKGHREAAREFDSEIKVTMDFSKQQLQSAKTVEQVVDSLEAELAEVRRSYARRGVNMEPQKEAIRAEFDEMVSQATTAKERQALYKRYQRDLGDLNLMRDRILGHAGIPDDPEQFAFRASQSMKRLNLARFGGTFGLSSVTDSAHIALRHGFEPMGHYIKNALQPLKAAKKSELSRLLWASEMTHAARRSMSMADIVDDFVGGSRLEKGIKAVSDHASKWFGIDVVNGAQKASTALIASDEFIKLSKKIADGTISKKKLAQLARVGIDAKMAKRILAMGEHFEQDGKFFLSHSDRWTDLEAATTFRTAVLASVHNTIIEPGVADLPAIMSQPVLSSFLQFKSFMFATNNRILASALNEPDMATLAAMSSLVAWGGLIYGLKQLNSGRDFPDSPAALAYEAVDNSGALGIITDANNMLERATGYGLNRVLGGTGPSRYQSRNAVDAILGPSIGTISDFSAAANALGGALTGNEIPSSGVHATRRLLPLQNFVGIRQGLDHLEEVFK